MYADDITEYTACFAAEFLYGIVHSNINTLFFLLLLQAGELLRASETIQLEIDGSAMLMPPRLRENLFAHKDRDHVLADRHRAARLKRSRKYTTMKESHDVTVNITCTY